jgi:hypothetical protein
MSSFRYMLMLRIGRQSNMSPSAHYVWQLRSVCPEYAVRKSGEATVDHIPYLIFSRPSFIPRFPGRQTSLRQRAQAARPGRQWNADHALFFGTGR